MAKTITLKATHRHPSRPEGTMYEANGGRALLDLYQRHAVAYKHPKIEESAEDELPPAPRKKRRYKRRDMQAE